VSTINEMNLQIASAAEEQRVVAEEISRNIDTISRISATSANGARETSVASQTLQQHTLNLNSLIDHFKL